MPDKKEGGGLLQNREETIRHQFDYLCKKVLREKSRDIKKRLIKQAECEIVLSGLVSEYLKPIGVMDDYPSDNRYFNVAEFQVAIHCNELARVLSGLSSEKRNIVLLAYFWDMTDREIAEKLDMARSTVQRKRANTLKELKAKLELRENE